MEDPKLIIFASGEKEPGKGGSGARKLIEATLSGILRAQIVAVVSNHPQGGVFTRMQEFKQRGINIPFIHSPKEKRPEDYQRIIEETGAEWVALSGWLGQMERHDPRRTFNIHPAYDLERFGGKGFHGHHVHEAVMRAYRAGTVKYSGVTMHFATRKYDDPSAVFFKRVVQIMPDDTPDTLGQRVNKMEHEWQARITDLVIHEKIGWNGKDAGSIWGADIEQMPEI